MKTTLYLSKQNIALKLIVCLTAKMKRNCSIYWYEKTNMNRKNINIFIVYV